MGVEEGVGDISLSQLAAEQAGRICSGECPVLGILKRWEVLRAEREKDLQVKAAKGAALTVVNALIEMRNI